MWGANYVLRVYCDGTDEQVAETGFSGQVTDDDVEAMEWLSAEAEKWAPSYRLELQTENNGWVQTLKTAQGVLACGHEFRSTAGRCNDGSWCS